MDPIDKELQQLRREVENLTLQFEHLPEWVREIDYAGITVDVREFFQRVISRYQLECEEHISQRHSRKNLLPNVNLNGVRILTVEDNADVSTLLTIILEASGAEVVCASAGPAALELLQSGLFQILISDIAMPGMDGLEFLRQVRALGSRMPAIALSAYATNDDRQAALNAGFDLFVPKPVHPSRLVSEIARLVIKESGQAAP